MRDSEEELRYWLKELGQEHITLKLLNLVDGVADLKHLTREDLGRLQLPEDTVSLILEKAGAICLKEQRNDRRPLSSSRRLNKNKSQVRSIEIDWTGAREGMLEKKAQDSSLFGVKINGSFQPRWFSLDKGVLSYYSEDGAELKKRYRWFRCLGQLHESSQFVFRVEMKERPSDSVGADLV